MKSFVSEHPWMTFFLAGAAIQGVVTIVRGHPQPLGAFPQPRFVSVRGSYR